MRKFKVSGENLIKNLKGLDQEVLMTRILICLRDIKRKIENRKVESSIGIKNNEAKQNEVASRLHEKYVQSHNICQETLLSIDQAIQGIKTNLTQSEIPDISEELGGLGSRIPEIEMIALAQIYSDSEETLQIIKVLHST